VVDKPNVLGLAIKQLLKRGFKYEGEIRPREEIFGVIMKQHFQSFILIAKAAGFGDIMKESVLTVHRFLITASHTEEQPLVLAYKPWDGKIRFYAFDPWKIKKESTIIHSSNYVGYEFPLSLGWRYELSKELETLWHEMRMTRYEGVKLDRFFPRKPARKSFSSIE